MIYLKQQFNTTLLVIYKALALIIVWLFPPKKVQVFIIIGSVYSFFIMTLIPYSNVNICVSKYDYQLVLTMTTEELRVLEVTTNSLWYKLENTSHHCHHFLSHRITHHNMLKTLDQYSYSPYSLEVSSYWSHV